MGVSTSADTPTFHFAHLLGRTFPPFSSPLSYKYKNAGG